jgi:hypothetical protein
MQSISLSWRREYKGRRLGRWRWRGKKLGHDCKAPRHRTRTAFSGMRDRAVLVACVLRRGELSRMHCEHLAMRDGRWCFWISWGREQGFARWPCLDLRAARQRQWSILTRQAVAIRLLSSNVPRKVQSAPL